MIRGVKVWQSNQTGHMLYNIISVKFSFNLNVTFPATPSKARIKVEISYPQSNSATLIQCIVMIIDLIASLRLVLNSISKAKALQ